jgi:hypothetical protein
MSCSDQVYKCTYSTNEADSAGVVITTICSGGSTLADPASLCRKKFGPACRYNPDSGSEWLVKPMCATKDGAAVECGKLELESQPTLPAKP